MKTVQLQDSGKYKLVELYAMCVAPHGSSSAEPSNYFYKISAARTARPSQRPTEEEIELDVLGGTGPIGGTKKQDTTTTGQDNSLFQIRETSSESTSTDCS